MLQEWCKWYRQGVVHYSTNLILDKHKYHMSGINVLYHNVLYHLCSGSPVKLNIA